MSDKLEKKFYVEVIEEFYKTSDVDEIIHKMKQTLNVDISKDEVYSILNEDYELECRKMQYSLEMNYIFGIE